MISIERLREAQNPKQLLRIISDSLTPLKSPNRFGICGIAINICPCKNCDAIFAQSFPAVFAYHLLRLLATKLGWGWWERDFEQIQVLSIQLIAMLSGENQSELQVYQCTFQAHVQKASMIVKFPCTYSVEIKTLNNKVILAATRQQVSAVNSIAVFNETLKFDTELLYNNKQREFVKKDVLMLLNLVSLRRPDQQKLVGRITIDLSEAIQTHYFSQLQNYRLDYCSVSASVTFNMRFVGKRLSHTHPQNFDTESLNDFELFIAGLHKDSSHKHRGQAAEESQKTLEMPWKSKVSSGISKNKIIQESYHEEAESKVNAGVASHKAVPLDDNLMKPQAPQSQNQQPLRQRYPSTGEPDAGVPSRASHIEAPSNYEISNAEDTLSRVKSEQPHTNPNLQTPTSPHPFFAQPINQYEEILRHSHAQEKIIWEEERRLLNEQITREKTENVKDKQRNNGLEKKLYETQLKLCNMEGRIENCKRQMVLLEKQKDLEIKELKARLEKTNKDKNDKQQIIDNKEIEIKELKDKLKNQENNKKNDNSDILKQNESLQQKLNMTLKQLKSAEQMVKTLQKQKNDIQHEMIDFQKRNNQLTNEVKDIQLKLKQTKNELNEQLTKTEKQLSAAFDKQRKQMKDKINKLQQTVSQNEFKINDLTIELQDRREELQRVTQLLQESSSRKSRDSSKRKSLNPNTKMAESKQSMEGTIAKMKEQMREKDQHIELLKAGILPRSDHQQNQNYAKALEESILELVKKLKDKQSENQQLKHQLRQLRSEQPQKMTAQKYSKLQSLTNSRIAELQQQIQKQNIELKDKAHQLQKLSPQKQQHLEEYILQLQNQLRRLTTLTESAAGKSSLGEQLKLIQKENKGKDEEIESLNRTIRLLKENQRGLDPRGDKELKYPIIQNQPNQMEPKFRWSQRILLEEQKELQNNNIMELKQTIEQQKQYIASLQKQLPKQRSDSRTHKQQPQKQPSTNSPPPAPQHPVENPAVSPTQRETELTAKVQQLQSLIQHYKQYQEGLQQKILDDHEISLAAQKNGMSETEMELANRIKVLESTLQHNKEYQEDLEQRILQDNDNKVSENELKNNLGLLTMQIQQQKEYQQGLEEKILSDHQKLETIEKKYSELLTTVSKKDNAQDGKGSKQGTPTKGKNGEPRPEETLHKKCEEEKKRLEEIIQELEESLSKVLESSPPRRREDEDYLVLQEKLNEKETYIGELEAIVKSMQNEIYKLEEEIAECYAEKEERQQEHDNNGDNKKQTNNSNQHQDVLQTQTFEPELPGTVIRVISVHTPSEDEEMQNNLPEESPKCQEHPKPERLTTLLKRSVQESQIDQPPSLCAKGQVLDLSDDLSHYDSPSKGTQQMVVSEVPKKSKSLCLLNDKQQRMEIQSQSIQKSHEEESKEHKPVKGQEQPIVQNSKTSHDKKSVKRKQFKDMLQQTEQLKLNSKEEEAMRQLERKMKAKEKQNQQDTTSNKNLKDKLMELSNARPQAESEVGISELQLKLQEFKVYTEHLQLVNKEYEGRIKLMKDKQGKIENEITVIEEESQMIVRELEERARERDGLKEQLESKIRDFETLKQQIGEKEDSSRKGSEGGRAKEVEEMGRLQSENQEHQKQIAQLRQKVKEYEQDFSKRNQEQMEHQKHSEEQITNLQQQLNTVNRQLTTNRKLFAKLRGVNRQSTTSVEQDIKFATINEENKYLTKKTDDLEKKVAEFRNSDDQKNKQIAQLSKQLQLQHCGKHKQTLDNGSINNDIKLLRKTCEEGQLKLKQQEQQMARMQVQIKEEKLEYYNKRRELLKENQRYLQENQLLRHKLQDSEKQFNSIIIAKKKSYKIVGEDPSQQILKSATNQPQDNKTKIEPETNKSLTQAKQIDPKSEENIKLVEYVEELEKLIEANSEKLREKNQQIQKLKSEVQGDKQGQLQKQQQRELHDQLNFYSEELAIITKKYEELEYTHTSQAKELEDSQKEVQDLNAEVQELTQALNQFRRKQVEGVQPVTRQVKQEVEDSHVKEKKALQKKLQQIQLQFDEHKGRSQELDRANKDRLTEMQGKLRIALDEKDKAVEQLEQKQMQHMNTELDLQFKLREKNEKSQAEMVRSMSEHQNKKSFNASQDVGAQDLISASKLLKELIVSRCSKNMVEQQMEFMVLRIAQLEDQLFNSTLAVKEKGLILQKTRLLSMEFSKFKVNIMKFKLQNEQRIKFLSLLRPLENSIKDILRLSEIYIENLFSQDLVAAESFNNA